MSMTISSEGAHEAFMAMTTTMAMKATNVDNEVPWAGARNFLIPSRNGNHDSKQSATMNDKCRTTRPHA